MTKAMVQTMQHRQSWVCTNPYEEVSPVWPGRHLSWDKQIHGLHLTMTAFDAAVRKEGAPSPSHQSLQSHTWSSLSVKCCQTCKWWLGSHQAKAVLFLQALTLFPARITPCGNKCKSFHGTRGKIVPLPSVWWDTLYQWHIAQQNFWQNSTAYTNDLCSVPARCLIKSKLE